MLSDLHIENIAVIERTDISFTPGLNVLTGETGAGKSIIIDALLAIMGGRTSRELVRAGADKALATAVFSTKRADGWLAENELENEDELILQRRISEEGKSSCRICGNPATAAQLRELSSLLLDIHGQNDGRQLMDETRHRIYLDSFGGYDDIIEAFSAAYARCRVTQKEIKRLTMDEAEKERLTQNLKIMVDELESADLKDGEEASLSERRDLLRNAEKLTEAIDAAYSALYGDDASAVTLADTAAKETERAARFCAELSEVRQSITDASFNLRDAAETLRDFARSLDFSPEEYDRLETRLALLRRLSKKYGGDEAELIEKLEKAKIQLDEMECSDDRLNKLSKLLETQKNEARAAAKKLSEAREIAARELEARIVAELRALAMPSVRFLVDITPIENAHGFDSTGADVIKFLMSANRGEKPGSISHIASGGELSRIMLAMKNVFSERDGTETLVFDEIDTGVSGVAAQRVGEKLAELSRGKQVLCVTHLPQIAAMADTHFLIEKAEQDGRTFTSVTRLSKDGRAHELARLHGGDNITANTLISAEEQLDAAEKFKELLNKSRRTS
ncbi:MAG: DNA repair protein RecN [Oscillospiraceae bacterium]